MPETFSRPPRDPRRLMGFGIVDLDDPAQWRTAVSFAVDLAQKDFDNGLRRARTTQDCMKQLLRRLGRCGYRRGHARYLRKVYSGAFEGFRLMGVLRKAAEEA